MYDKIKVLFNSLSYCHAVIGGIVLLSVFCIWYIFHEPSGTNYNDSRNAVEQAQEQQRKSLELNRDIQSAIDRSAELGHEAKGRIERSTQYNRQINDRIGQSQSGLSEARSYLERNVELFDRIERESRERREDYQTLTNATQPIPNVGSGGDNRNCDTQLAR